MAGRARSGLPGLLLCLFLPAGLCAQEAAEKRPETPKAQASRPSPKPVLAEATRVSTDDAIKSAAQKKSGTSESESPVAPSSDPAVTELQPVTHPPETSTAAGGESAKTAQKSRNIHSTVQGTMGAGGQGSRRSGAAVGATSKSGKSSIYVETDRSRTNPPASK